MRSKRLIRVFRFLVPAAILSCIFHLSIFSGPVHGGEPKSGGRLVFGVENEFAGFDAIKIRGLAICGAIANNTVNERLFDLDDSGRLIPILGLSADPSADGLTWTVKLRPGVMFHDGTPFNARAVVDHYTRLLDAQNRYADLTTIQTIAAVEERDDHTVIFKLKHPWPTFLVHLCNPRTLGPYIPSPKAVKEGRQARSPVGTGPFMFKEWVTGDRFVVVKNPNYWQKGKPYLDEIVFKPMIDHQTRYASLLAGQARAIWADHGAIIRKAEKDPLVTVHVGLGNGAEIMIFNTTKPPLDDVRVRRALAHAWNQPQYVKLSYQDTIPVVEHPFGDSNPCIETGYLEYDPAKARALLAEYGHPVELEVLHSNSRRGKEVGEISQQFFKEVGVTVKSVGLDFAPVIKKVYSRDYQISSWRIPPGLDQGPGLFMSYHSGSRRNITGYHSPEMDKLLTAQNRESDPEKRKEILCRIIRRLNEDAVILYRGGKRFHVISRPEVRGIDPIRYGIPSLAGVWLE